MVSLFLEENRICHYPLKSSRGATRMNGERSLSIRQDPACVGAPHPRAEPGDRNGEPIVFLHGWPDSWFSFSRVLPLLPPRLRSLAIDQRGFGDSDRPESGYTIPDLAADVVGF